MIRSIFLGLFSSSAPSNRYLLVVEVVYEGGEAPGLVLQGQRQHWDIADEYGVKEPCHFQVVAGTQRLENQ